MKCARPRVRSGEGGSLEDLTGSHGHATYVDEDKTKTECCHEERGGISNWLTCSGHASSDEQEHLGHLPAVCGDLLSEELASIVDIQLFVNPRHRNPWFIGTWRGSILSQSLSSIVYWLFVLLDFRSSMGPSLDPSVTRMWEDLPDDLWGEYGCGVY